jgi:hypothetical protein
LGVRSRSSDATITISHEKVCQAVAKPCRRAKNAYRRAKAEDRRIWKIDRRNLYQRPEGLTGMRAGLAGRLSTRRRGPREINKKPEDATAGRLGHLTTSCPLRKKRFKWRNSVHRRHGRRRPAIHGFSEIRKARRGWRAFARHDGDGPASHTRRFGYFFGEPLSRGDPVADVAPKPG